MDAFGPLRFRRKLCVRDTVHDPGESASSRVATTRVLPSLNRTSSAFAIFTLSGLTIVPCILPVYASDHALPRRLQDLVSTCLLWL